jgi:hypothetical protein
MLDVAVRHTQSVTLRHACHLSRKVPTTHTATPFQIQVCKVFTQGPAGVRRCMHAGVSASSVLIMISTAPPPAKRVARTNMTPYLKHCNRRRLLRHTKDVTSDCVMRAVCMRSRLLRDRRKDRGKHYKSKKNIGEDVNNRVYTTHRPNTMRRAWRSCYRPHGLSWGEVSADHSSPHSMPTCKLQLTGAP